ncbi:MAG: hypothetical protein V1810_03960 [Candidatus Beckwithbacteria bacterium]
MMGNEWSARFEAVNPMDFYRSVVEQALHFVPTQDAFRKTRNKALIFAQKKAQDKFPNDEVSLTQEINQELREVQKRLQQGRTVIETQSFGERIWPVAPVELKLTSKIKKRALWWNQRAMVVLESSGIEGLINDPSFVCLALGTGQWLDAGNFMVEPRFVGDSLEIAKKNGVDLYKEFGLQKEDFVFFPHMKHKPGFYNETYSHLLFGDRVTEVSFKKSYRLILELMEKNEQNVLLVPGTWFYDPNLPKVDSKFFWVPQTAEKIVLLGKAAKIDPIQFEFAVDQSARRKELNKTGEYEPQIAAAYSTREFLRTMIESDYHESEKTKATTSAGIG